MPDEKETDMLIWFIRYGKPTDIRPTGDGFGAPAVYGPFRSREDAEAAEKRLREVYARVAPELTMKETRVFSSGFRSPDGVVNALLSWA